jgi:hypothetical protein
MKERNFANHLQNLTQNEGEDEEHEFDRQKEEEQRPVKSMPKYEYDETHPEI